MLANSQNSRRIIQENPDDLKKEKGKSSKGNAPKNIKKVKKMSINGLIWNCRGLTKKGVSTFLKDLISQNRFHFVGLQETMIKDCEEKVLRKFDSNKDYLWLYNPSKGKSGGILVGARNEFYDVGSFQQGDFMLQMNLWDKSNKIKWNL